MNGVTLGPPPCRAGLTPWIGLLLVAHVLGASGGVVAAPVLMTADANADQLYLVDHATELLTAVGPLADPIVASLTFDKKRSIVYAASTQTNSLLRIDLETAAITPVGSFGVPLMHSLEFNEVHDVLYGASNANGHLYTIDLATGAATSVGPTGISALGGLAYDRARNLMYATDAGPARSTGLFAVNLATAQSTWIGPFDNAAAEHIVDLAYDERHGLYGVDNGLSAGEMNQLFSIDPATGMADFVRDLHIGNFLGLTFVVPEPSASMATFCAGMMVACRPRRSRATPRR